LKRRKKVKKEGRKREMARENIKFGSKRGKTMRGEGEREDPGEGGGGIQGIVARAISGGGGGEIKVIDGGEEGGDRGKKTKRGKLEIPLS